MPVSARSYELRIHAATIVANQKPKLARGVLNFQYNRGGAGMAEGIGKSFAPDEINLIMNNRSQPPWRAFHDDTKFALGGNGEILLDTGKFLFEILANDV